LQDHPLDQLRLIVSDPYRPPPGKSDARHHGVDFSYYRFGERATIQGVGVQAVLPGRVAAALADTFPFGNLVMIETESTLLPSDLQRLLGAEPGESLYLFYAHLESAPSLRIGDLVEACQPIGAVGKSGNAVEPHLHLEARLGPAETVFTEMGEYFPEASPAEKAAYQLWRTSGVYRHLDPMILINFALDTP
jgi:murein DD-endopeptidase MepM/ murein hydrolase activator NlpD